MPKTLVIETATAACSVAVIQSGQLIAERHVEVGRGHAERLLPMIAELPDGGRADSILVDCGPGSFTGIRVGIAAARGLGLGWGVPVLGFSSLPLVAAQAFDSRSDLEQVDVVLEGGHGEVFVTAFTRDFSEIRPFASLKPDAAIAQLSGRHAIGNGVRHLTALTQDLDLIDALPRSADARLLPTHLTNLPARPIYGRAPDAKPKAVKPA